MGLSNVYTVLVLIAAIALLVAIVYVFVRSGELFDSGPFSPSAQLQIIQDASKALLKA